MAGNINLTGDVTVPPEAVTITSTTRMQTWPKLEGLNLGVRSGSPLLPLQSILGGDVGPAEW